MVINISARESSEAIKENLKPDKIEEAVKKYFEYNSNKIVNMVLKGIYTIDDIYVFDVMNLNRIIDNISVYGTAQFIISKSRYNKYNIYFRKNLRAPTRKLINYSNIESLSDTKNILMKLVGKYFAAYVLYNFKVNGKRKLYEDYWKDWFKNNFDAITIIEKGEPIDFLLKFKLSEAKKLKKITTKK